MTPITVNTFKSVLKNWVDARFSKIPNFSLPFFSQGGWEGWIQVEWAMYFTMLGYDIVREIHAYEKHNIRADLVLNSQIPSSPNIVIEIKCQSIYTDIGAFCSSIDSDEKKLALLSNGQRGVMFVVVVEPTIFESLLKLGYFQIPLVQSNICIMYKIIK